MREPTTIAMTLQRERSINQAVRDYGQRLMRFIRGRVGNLAEAEDILQDVWYQLSNISDVGTIEQLSAWLFRVARNKITDRHRQKKPLLLNEVATEDDDDNESVLALLSDLSTPETEFNRRFFWQELLTALDELPEEQKQVYILNELENRTFREISELTGVNIKTLISRKRYAVKYLRKRLEPLREDITD
jgi:RNA polymerase sigma factor (sigma-70 family)